MRKKTEKMHDLKNLKIGTLNLCLGLKNKKDLIKAILIENNIDILCMQELEVEHDFDCNLLRIPGFVLEIENNNRKKRVGCYIRDNLKFIRRNDLEKVDCNMLILDLVDQNETAKRILFSPLNFTEINFKRRPTTTRPVSCDFGSCP